MGNHISPGFIFNTSHRDSNNFSIESLNQLVSGATIQPSLIENAPVKIELKSFDKFLVFDSFSGSLQSIESKNLFHNVKLSGESTSITPHLNDSSDRIVTTKFLNLLLGNFSENAFINYGLTFLKTTGNGNGSKIYSISNYHSHNHDKYLIFVDGFIMEHLVDYIIDKQGNVIFEEALQDYNTYLFLTLNNPKCGSSHFNKLSVIINEEKNWLETSFSNNNPNNYLIFVDKVFLNPIEDFTIQNGLVSFKKNIALGCRVLIYHLPTNNNSSYFEFCNFISDEQILDYSLPVFVGKTEEDYLVFVDGRILIPGNDYLIKNNQFIQFTDKIPSNLTISIYALINNNNILLASKNLSKGCFFKIQNSYFTENKLILENYTGENKLNYLFFCKNKLLIDGVDLQINKETVFLKNQEYANDLIQIVTIINEETIRVSSNLVPSLKFIKYKLLHNFNIELEESAQPNNILIFNESGSLIPPNCYNFTSDLTICFSENFSENLIILKLEVPDDKLLYNIPSIPLDKISSNNAEHGDTIAYNINSGSWEPINLLKDDLKITDFTLPLSNISTENAEDGDCIYFDGLTKKWISKRIEKRGNNGSFAVNDFSNINKIIFDENRVGFIHSNNALGIIFKKIKLSDLDRNNIKEGRFIKFDGKNWVSSLPSVICIEKTSNVKHNIDSFIFGDNFDLKFLGSRVLLDLKKEIPIQNLHAHDAVENDILMFKDGQYKSVPPTLMNPAVINVYESGDLREEYANSIIISNTPNPITLNIPNYKDTIFDIGSQIKIIQASTGSIKISYDPEEIEIISELDEFITNKRGSKIELLKITHRKWYLFS